MGSETIRLLGELRLSDIIDRFIPADLRTHAATHRRAHMFILSQAFGPLIAGCIPIYMYASDLSRDYRIYILFASFLPFWAYPVLLRLTGRYQLLAFLSVGNMIFAALWACFAYGGLTSPFLPWLLLAPFLAFLYLPPRGWVCHLLIGQIFGSVLGFVALCFSGYPLPRVEIDDLQTVGLISMATLAAYFALMSLYFAELFREHEQFALELNGLVSTAENLSHLTTVANRASRAKADFVASMSHELRTPLNAIIGYSLLLLEEAVEEEDEATVADIGHVHDAGSHLLRLIDNILTYSRIEAGRMPVNPFPDTVARQSREWLDHPYLADIAGRLAIDPPIPPDVMVTDWTLVGEVVRQLLRGIASQRSEGVIRIAVAAATRMTLSFTLAVDGERGERPGFNLHKEMFEHGDDASSSKYGATGIEIPLARKLAELLGGTIIVTRAPPGEQVIVLTLPSMIQPDRLAA